MNNLAHHRIPTDLRRSQRLIESRDLIGEGKYREPVERVAEPIAGRLDRAGRRTSRLAGTSR